MANNAKNFLVSTADFAFYYNDTLAATGICNLSSAIEVSMQDQEVRGGIGNKLLMKFKHSRAMSVTLEAADFSLAYLAIQTGSQIAEKLSDVYRIGKCHDVVAGVVTLAETPIGDVAVELANGQFVTVTPEGVTVDLNKFGITEGTVNVTYKYQAATRSITVDTDSTPMVGKLVMISERHNNKIGRVGTLQIEVPSFQLSGNYTLDLSAEGVSSTSMQGDALAVEGDKCTDGSSVYAYISEVDDTPAEIVLSEIVATPAEINIKESEQATISVVGVKGALYSNVEIDNADCAFVSDTPGVATVGASTGVVEAVGAGQAKITVTYAGKYTDEVTVNVTE